MNDSRNYMMALHGFLSGLIIGSLVGAVGMRWLTPRSGKKAQQIIHRDAGRV